MKKILLALAAFVAFVGSASACNYGNVQALVAQQNLGYTQTYGYTAPLQLNVGRSYGVQNVQFLNSGYGYGNTQFLNSGYGGGFQAVRVQRQFVYQQPVVVQRVVVPRRNLIQRILGY